MKGGELRQRPADRRGLSLSQRRALVVAKNNNGLVRVNRIWRASFAPGSEKIKTLTVESLVMVGLLMRSGERLVSLTAAGHMIAEESVAIAREAANAVMQRRAVMRPRYERAVQRRQERTPGTVRLPYADN